MTYTRAEASYPTWTPGVTAPTRVHYGLSSYEHLRVYRATTPPALNAGLIIGIPGGLYHDPGDATLTGPPGGPSVYDALRAQGWHVVIIERVPTMSNLDHRIVPTEARFWPAHLLSVARAVMYLKSLATSATLWGAGSSIDIGRIWLYGQSSGWTTAATLALMPPGAIPYDGINQIGLPLYDSSYDHRVRGVAGQIGQVDWTQFVFDPAWTTGAPETLAGAYAYDVHQAVTMKVGNPSWTTAPQSWKKSMSPWWWLVANFPGNKNVSFWSRWTTGIAFTSGNNLTSADWLPGSPRNDIAGKKAFTDPHHPYQATPWHDKLTALGIPARTLLANTPIGSATAVADVSDDTVSYILSH